MCQSIQASYKFCGCKGALYQQKCPTPSTTCQTLLTNPTDTLLTCYCDRHSSQSFRSVRQDQRQSARVGREYRKDLARENSYGSGGGVNSRSSSLRERLQGQQPARLQKPKHLGCSSPRASSSSLPPSPSPSPSLSPLSPRSRWERPGIANRTSSGLRDENGMLSRGEREDPAESMRRKQKQRQDQPDELQVSSEKKEEEQTTSARESKPVDSATKNGYSLLSFDNVKAELKKWIDRHRRRTPETGEEEEK